MNKIRENGIILLEEANVIYERCKFNERSQQQSETFGEYFTNPRELVKTCQFADIQNDLLRDRIAVGIRDDGLRIHNYCRRRPVIQRMQRHVPRV